MDALSHALLALFQEQERPDDPLEYPFEKIFNLHSQ